MQTAPPEGPLADLQRRLGAVAQRVAMLFPAAHGAGTTMLLADGTAFVGSNAFTDAVDHVQYRLGEGPCWAAVAGGREVRSTLIGFGEPRWPVFSESAGALDLRSAISVPIFAGAEVAGSLNLYSRSAGGLDEVDSAALRRSAQDAEDALATTRLVALAAGGARTLAVAVGERVEIDLAIGALMGRYRITADQAGILLGQLARQDGLTLAAAAWSVIRPAV